MKKLFLMLILFLTTHVSAFASTQDLNLTEEDIKKSAQDVVDCYHGKLNFNYNLFEDGKQIGGIYFQDKDATIVYRGAQGLNELMGCALYGNDDIHQGFLASFNKFSENIIQGISEYSSNKDLNLFDISYRIVGHSRGTGFVPQTVEALLDIEIHPQQIRAISFSPFKIYSTNKANEYNEKFGKKYHFGFRAEEDTLINDMEKFIHWPSLGTIVEYKATENPHFNEWIKLYPYLNLDESMSLMKAVIPVTKWNSHQAESYLLTAPSAYEKWKK